MAPVTDHKLLTWRIYQLTGSWRKAHKDQIETVEVISHLGEVARAGHDLHVAQRALESGCEPQTLASIFT